MHVSFASAVPDATEPSSSSSSIGDHSTNNNSNPKRDDGEEDKNRQSESQSSESIERPREFEFPTFEWPRDLILVRHGQSEGNAAVALSRNGDLRAYTPEFKLKHSSMFRLTTLGEWQARKAGDWVRQHIGTHFDRYYTSEYVRAMETAALLDLPDAKWYTEMLLRERDKGHLDNTSWEERMTKYADELERRSRDVFYWRPPSGESLAQVCIRVDHTFNTLRRECSNRRVIIVCHGGTMWSFRVRVERLSQQQFHALQRSRKTNPKDDIHNCQVIHYSRVHPTTGELFKTFRFMRSVCPWDLSRSTNAWVEFQRPTYSNEQLLENIQQVPRYVE